MTRLLVAVGCLLVAAGSIFAQGIPADGTEILRGLLKYQGFTPSNQRGNPASTLVVVVGMSNVGQNVKTLAQDALAQGGALLVISDDDFPLVTFLPNDGNLNPNTRITANEVECPQVENTFRGQANSPFAMLTGRDPTKIGQFKAGGAKLATRRPRTIFSPDGNPYLGVPIATFPPGSRFVGGAAVGVTIELGIMTDPDLTGTAVVFSNRAMFTNELMIAADANGNRTDNFLYTYLMTKYLADRIQGPNPKVCIFIENGRLVTDFDRVSFVQQPGGKLPPIVPPLMPPLPLLLDFALDKGNELVAKAEEKDIPNAFQAGDTNNRFQNAWLYGVAVISSIVLLRYLLARGWSTRHTPEQTPRLRINPDHDGGMIPERRRGLLESGNLYEPLRDHLRFIFAQWGATAREGTEFPGITTDRVTRPRQRILSDLYKLWEIAFRPQRSTITPDDLEELEDMIADLSQAHEAGVWRLAADGGAA